MVKMTVTADAASPANSPPAQNDSRRPTFPSVMSLAEAKPFAEVFRAVGDPIRIRLLSLIENSPHHEACVCDLTELMGLSQPTVSHHLKILVDAGLLTRSKRGRWSYYTVVGTALDELGTLLAGSDQPNRPET
jgi:ArsR family transcriptional regulator, arsenate/arsenite/antimonite-responsive transcriptional repressor